MTLITQIRDRREGDQISVSGPVRDMTTQTLRRHILVSRIDHLLPHRVICVLRPIVTALAKLDDGRLLQKEIAVRRM